MLSSPRLLPKVDLILAPTPLHRLPNLSERLGIDLWIKRDDLTGFALGGNKGRKLEYFLGDAIAQEADVIVTCGSLQSNFIRQLGVGCAMVGLECAAATMILPYASYNGPPDADPMHYENGNVLLDELVGVDLRMYENSTWEQLYVYAEDLAKEYETSGKRVYRIPIGGSSGLGAYAFYRAGLELQGQLSDVDWVVFASSSGSTHTGLGYAYKDQTTRILGFACDPEPDLVDDFALLASDLADLRGEQSSMRPADFLLNLDYVGPGYGVPSVASMAAIRTLAKSEGIFLDPVYSGKAFAGLLDLAEKQKIKGRVVFWHTGGVPSLFALPPGNDDLPSRSKVDFSVNFEPSST